MTRRGHFGQDSWLGQFDGVVAGKRDFVVMGKLDIEAVAMVVWRLGPDKPELRGNSTAVGNAGAAESRVAEPQDSFVPVEITGRIGRSISKVRFRVRT